MATGQRLGKAWEKEAVQLVIPSRPGNATHYRYFNVNYFPERVEPLMHAAEERYAMLLLYAISARSQLAKDIKDLLKAVPLHIECGPRNWPRDTRYIGVYHGAAGLAMLHGFLVTLKSLLDVVASAWALTVKPRCGIRAFRKGKVDGIELSGGKLVNWLRGEGQQHHPKTLPAADTIVQHSQEWITQAVRYRDWVVHYGRLPGLTPLAIVLDNTNVDVEETGTMPRRVYAESEVLPPRLEDGREVDVFCADITKRTNRFLQEMSTYFALKESRVPAGPPEPGDRMYISERLLHKAAQERETKNRRSKRRKQKRRQSKKK